MKLRIDMALVRAKEAGRPIMKKELAAKLWPDVNEVAQQVNMTNLCSGRRQSVKPEWVLIICDMCGCSADFLFGRTND